jgi:hypothetical protein
VRRDNINNNQPAREYQRERSKFDYNLITVKIVCMRAEITLQMSTIASSLLRNKKARRFYLVKANKIDNSESIASHLSSTVIRRQFAEICFCLSFKDSQIESLKALHFNGCRYLTART